MTVANSFNNAAYNTEREGMEKALDNVVVFDKGGRKTAYVSDVTLWIERPLISDWIRSTYKDIDRVSFGASEKNPFNVVKKALGFKDAPRGEEVFKGALYLEESKKPVGLKPDPTAYPPMHM